MKTLNQFIFCLLGSLAISSTGYPASAQEPPSVGIYSLPFSQMPGPLFSFGQNIIGKDILQFYAAPGFQKTTSEQY